MVRKQFDSQLWPLQVSCLCLLPSPAVLAAAITTAPFIATTSPTALIAGPFIAESSTSELPFSTTTPLPALAHQPRASGAASASLDRGCEQLQ